MRWAALRSLTDARSSTLELKHSRRRTIERNPPDDCMAVTYTKNPPAIDLNSPVKSGRMFLLHAILKTVDFGIDQD
jgi:hypothetical protein